MYTAIVLAAIGALFANLGMIGLLFRIEKLEEQRRIIETNLAKVETKIIMMEQKEK